VVGNAVKAGVRFVSYDQFKHMLADKEVRRFLESGSLVEADERDMFVGKGVGAEKFSW
jgi:hypothetical protein